MVHAAPTALRLYMCTVPSRLQQLNTHKARTQSRKSIVRCSCPLGEVLVVRVCVAVTPAVAGGVSIVLLSAQAEAQNYWLALHRPVAATSDTLILTVPRRPATAVWLSGSV